MDRKTYLGEIFNLNLRLCYEIISTFTEGKQGAEQEVEQPGYKPAPMWYPGACKV